jgi:inner membrane protein
MDSLTHVVLGAAVGTAVLGRRAGPRAALWGAVCGTLPDLDVLIRHGDPVRDFTFHRAESHAFFYLTLLAPLLGWLLARLHRGTASVGRWTALAWLALVTHALLDAFTVYGTQLLLPFSDYPAGLGSIFIIDPLFTVPLLAGLAVALALHRPKPGVASRANAWGLAVGTLYLGWTVAAQAHVEGVVHRALAATPLEAGRVLVTPTPFNTLLWRVVVMGEDGYHEGFHSLLDRGDGLLLARHESRTDLIPPLRGAWNVQRLAWFSKGFYGVQAAPANVATAVGSASAVAQLFGAVPTAVASDSSPGDTAPRVTVSDLRMGQTPFFAFTFVVGTLGVDGVTPATSLQLPAEPPTAALLGWMWRRIWDEASGLPPGASHVGQVGGSSPPTAR